MRAIDTDVLVRLIARDDAAQVKRAETFVAAGAWVSHLVLAESIWVLESVYRLDKARLRTAISMLLEHQQLVVQEADVVRMAIDAFVAHRGVSFTDCLVAAVARCNGHTPLGTFDRKLSRLNEVSAL